MLINGGSSQRAPGMDGGASLVGGRAVRCQPRGARRAYGQVPLGRYARSHEIRGRMVACSLRGSGMGDGTYLEGNVSANEIDGVPKPRVKAWQEWDDNGRKLHGELCTYI